MPRHAKGLGIIIIVILLNVLFISQVIGSSPFYLPLVAGYNEPGAEIQNVYPIDGGTCSFNGGAVTLTYGASVLPDNAAYCQYIAYAFALNPLPAGVQGVLFFDLTIFDGSQQAISLANLSSSITVTITYPDVLPAGVDESTLQVRFYEAGKWLNTNIVSRDTANNRITVAIDHLTEFALTTPHINYLPIIFKNDGN